MLSATVERLYLQPPSELEGVKVEFRITYRGPLPAQGSDSRVREKQAIRKVLHPQLKELWNQNSWMGDAGQMASDFARCGFRFIPIIRKSSNLGCVINILFLRRDNPGNLIRSGGDIDNRIKVLFDGLRMPQECNEVAGASPDADEDPFFCLLQDDALITELHVTTDRLLTPISGDERLHDVELTIHVVSNIDVASMDHIRFIEHHAVTAYLANINRDKW
jgi:hypothetical protein